MKFVFVLAACIAFVGIASAQNSNSVEDYWDLPPPRFGYRYSVHNPRTGSGGWIQGGSAGTGAGYYSGSRGYTDRGRSPGIAPLDPRLGTGPYVNTGPRGGRYVIYRGNTGAPGIAIREDY